MDDHEIVRQAFLDAVRHGRTDLADAASEVGASAATQGLPLHVVLDHVERAYEPGPPDARAVRAVAESWAERMVEGAFTVSCHDPLTSWGTVPHLRTHLEDLYRRAASTGEEVAEGYALVVVELVARRGDHGLESSLRALDVGEVVHTVFPAHVTTARLTDVRFAVLVAAHEADPVGCALLDRLLGRAFEGAVEPRRWVERLPHDVDGVTWLLQGLTR